MSRPLIVPVVVTLLFSSSVLHADQGSAAARDRGFKPLWTSIGAGAGFGLGVWAGLTKFDDAINSDRKVWTTAIVSAAVGGVLGFLVDRKQARSSNPSIAAPARFAPPDDWRRQIYGSSTAPVTLRPPSVATVSGLQRPR
jgi:hypothetical protein